MSIISWNTLFNDLSLIGNFPSPVQFTDFFPVNSQGTSLNNDGGNGPSFSTSIYFSGGTPGNPPASPPNQYQMVVTLSTGITGWYPLMNLERGLSNPSSQGFNFLITIPSDITGTDSSSPTGTVPYPTYGGVLNPSNTFPYATDGNGNNIYDSLLQYLNNGISGNAPSGSVVTLNNLPEVFFVLNFYQWQVVNGTTVPVLVGKAVQSSFLPPSKDESVVTYYDVTSSSPPSFEFDFAMVMSFGSGGSNFSLTLLSQNLFSPSLQSSGANQYISPVFPYNTSTSSGSIYNYSSQFGLNNNVYYPNFLSPTSGTPTFIFTSDTSGGSNTGIVNTVGMLSTPSITNVTAFPLLTQYNFNTFLEVYTSSATGSELIQCTNISQIFLSFQELKAIIDTPIFPPNGGSSVYDQLRTEYLTLFTTSINPSSFSFGSNGVSFTITINSLTSGSNALCCLSSTLPSSGNTFSDSYSFNVNLPSNYNLSTASINDDSLIYVNNSAPLSGITGVTYTTANGAPAGASIVTTRYSTTKLPSTNIILQFYKFTLGSPSTVEKVASACVGGGNTNVYQYDITSNSPPSFDYDFALLFSYQTGGNNPNISFLSPSNFGVSITTNGTSGNPYGTVLGIDSYCMWPTQPNASEASFNLNALTNPQSFVSTTLSSVPGKPQGVFTNPNDQGLIPLTFNFQSNGCNIKTSDSPSTRYSSFPTTFLFPVNGNVSFIFTGSSVIISNITSQCLNIDVSLPNSACYNSNNSVYYIHSSGYSSNTSGYSSPAFAFSTNNSVLTDLFIINSKNLYPSGSTVTYGSASSNSLNTNYACVLTTYCMNQYVSLFSTLLTAPWGYYGTDFYSTTYGWGMNASFSIDGVLYPVPLPPSPPPSPPPIPIDSYIVPIYPNESQGSNEYNLIN